MTIEIAGDTAALRKARGAFFTPPEVTSFLARWAIRSPEDRVLEPSSGDGAILAAAGQRLRELGSRMPLQGHELHESSAEISRARMRSLGYPVDVQVGDFLATPTAPRFDAVVGNPPYVRYQGFTGEARTAGLAAALAQGVRLSRLSSSWAPFVIHASAHLTPTGRMALVLPAELLSSNYAQGVRDYLLERFAHVSVVLIDRQVFPGVQTEALLLLAEGTGGTKEVRFATVSAPSDLTRVSFDTSLTPQLGERWTAALVSDEASDLVAGAQASGLLAPLGDWGRLSLGAVTGNNRFFTLTPGEAAERGLAPSDLVPISPAGSRHLRALSFSQADHDELGRTGLKTLLFRPDNPSKSALAYIRHGESLGVDAAYKCRVRRPWWRTPLPPPPDLFFTYMNEATPQMAANAAHVHYVNSVHGVYVEPATSDLVDVLPLAALNSATALSAEVTGRAYGGGVLKMEPREAVRLLVPSPATVRSELGPLRTLVPEARRLLRAGHLNQVRALVDDLLLREHDPKELSSIQEAHLLLSQRRRHRVGRRTTTKGSR
ncbi:MAG: N-6 DNA methylase [Propionibacteriaceae bacterium]|nr:N-6 DNA methylase [Propionibacteriaceae bacterium]